jgi:tellurite resistance protein TerC
VEWNTIWPWVGFNALVLGLLALDLGVFHRKAHTVHPREALTWSIVWITLSLLFNGLIWAWHGQKAALEFFTGYLIEKSLSVDNIFVFVIIFSYFRVPPKFQHRVLFWGIVGALIMRAILIGVGAVLLARFFWVEYIFGAFLVITGIRMSRSHEPEVHPEGNVIVRFFRRFWPVTRDYHEHRFFVKMDGRIMATPLFIVLLLVETTDVVFALDSIPAIFGVTKDPFIVYTSNIFAILGLRALYFLLASVIGMFEYLNLGLAAVLSFIGIKMLISYWVHIPIGISLAIVFGLLAISIVASIIKRRFDGRGGPPPPA